MKSKLVIGDSNKEKIVHSKFQTITKFTRWYYIDYNNSSATKAKKKYVHSAAE